MTDLERNTCGSERPKYSPAPRSGNAFAAAVFAAIAGLLLLTVLYGRSPDEFLAALHKSRTPSDSSF